MGIVVRYLCIWKRWTVLDPFVQEIKELEKFADLLDITIVNLKEANRSEELNDGLLYLKLQKKLPTFMLYLKNKRASQWKV